MKIEIADLAELRASTMRRKYLMGAKRSKCCFYCEYAEKVGKKEVEKRLVRRISEERMLNIVRCRVNEGFHYVWLFCEFFHEKGE